MNNLINNLLNSINPEDKERIEYRMLVAARIDSAMKAKGWKTKDLLHALGKKNPSEVTRWLSGTHNFTMDTLVDLQRVLGIRLLRTDLDPNEVSTYKATLSVNVSTKPQRSIYYSQPQQSQTYLRETNIKYKKSCNK